MIKLLLKMFEITKIVYAVNCFGIGTHKDYHC